VPVSAIDGPGAVNAVRQGTLTAAELDRLGEMLERGQVRSDPLVLSPADRVAGTGPSGRRWGERWGKGRSERRISPPSSRPQPEREWQVARTLSELIELRRALLCESDQSGQVSAP
jgi:hypothetical protein